ncbi:MAG: CPBP family intramembrane metalloprotease [Tissierellia bacterium]|nr:CPBP family intramembrane metalloprotease [Tissierellia bacterium]
MNYNENEKYDSNGDINLFDQENNNSELEEENQLSNENYELTEEEIMMLSEAKENSLKLVMRKTFFSLLIYVLVGNLIASLLALFMDFGLVMILVVTIPLLLVAKQLPFIKLKELFKYKRNDIKKTDIIYFFGLGLLLNAIISLAVAFILQKLGLQSTSVTQTIQTQMSPMLLIYVVLVGPIVEEILYRGYLGQNLARFSKNGAIIFVSIVFAISHLNIEQSFSIMGLAFLVTYIGLNYSFLMATILHILNNANSIIVLNLVEKFGESSAVVNVYSVALIFLMIYAAIRFFRRGRFDLKANIESSPEEKKYTKKILTSPYTFMILAFYLIMMYLTYQAQSLL